MASPRRTTPTPQNSMPEITSIGREFAERRITLRLTQQTLADLAGVSRSSVQSLERGSGSIKFGAVVAIANVLGMHIDMNAAAE